MVIRDDTSMELYLQEEKAYDKRKKRLNKLKKQTLDTIVNSHQMIKADYYYVKNYVAPAALNTMCYRVYDNLHKAYHKTVFALEYVKNLLLRK